MQNGNDLFSQYKSSIKCDSSISNSWSGISQLQVLTVEGHI